MTLPFDHQVPGSPTIANAIAPAGTAPKPEPSSRRSHRIWVQSSRPSALVTGYPGFGDPYIKRPAGKQTRNSLPASPGRGLRYLDRMAFAPTLNELGQLIGFALPDWRPPAWPSPETMHGQYCRLESPRSETPWRRPPFRPSPRCRRPHVDLPGVWSLS